MESESKTNAATPSAYQGKVGAVLRILRFLSFIRECSRLPLKTWLLAFYITTTARKGISSVQLAKELGITRKSAWFLQQRIRAACAQRKSPLTGKVEVDEACFGGKECN